MRADEPAQNLLAVRAAAGVDAVHDLAPEPGRSRDEIADELLDAFDSDAPVDLIKAYAGPLPVRAISELLGIPVAYQAGFVAIVDVLVNQSGAEQQRRRDRRPNHDAYQADRR